MQLRIRVAIATSLLLIGCDLVSNEPAGVPVLEKHVRLDQAGYQRIRSRAISVAHARGYSFSEIPARGDRGTIAELEKGSLVILISNPFQPQDFIVTGYCGLSCPGDEELSRTFEEVVNGSR
jgi:hypothetical protein